MALPSTPTTTTSTTSPPPQSSSRLHPIPPVPLSLYHPPPRVHNTPNGSYGHHNRVYGSPQPGHLIRPASLAHFTNTLGPGPSSSSILGPAPGPPLLLRPLPLSSYHKAIPSPAPVPDSNGYKEPRSKDDSFLTVRDRKVRVSGSSSLYAACRSWLRNGVFEETQPHYLDGIKLLPKPSPPPVPDAHSPAEQEPNKEEEKEEESVEHLSAKDLLKRHVNRAKKVRARLREERLQRIARYKTRLALLLPPLAEQQNQYRNESGAGN